MLIEGIKKHRYFILALFVIGFLVYVTNMGNPLFWDDDDWIINNPFVHSFSYIKDVFTKDVLAGIGLRSDYYRPILLLTFAFNYVIGGIKPLGYHLVSNLLHITNGVLIFLLLQNVLKRRIISFVAAFLFLIHPLQTEAVTYISGRGDPLNVFFMLWALWFFLGASRRSKILSFSFLVLAILSRETAIMFPFYLMVFYVAFLTKERFMKALRASFMKALPYFGITFVYGILRLTVLNFENTLNFYGRANVYTENVVYRIFTFFGALVTYVKLIFVPLGLHMEREMGVITSFFNINVLVVLAGLAALLWLLRFLYKREGKGISDFRIWFFGLSVFFINLGPTSGIFASINAFLYEHWLYFGLFGVFVIAGFYIDKLWTLIKNKGAWRYVLVGILIGYFGFFGVAAAKRNFAWKDSIAFYEDVLRYTPDSVRINNNLGNLYNQEGDLKKAEFYYQRSIESEDTFAQPHYNLGVIRMNEGNLEEAKKEYLRAVELNPSFYYAYQNLAFIYANEGDYVEATNVLVALLELRPNDSAVYYNLGLVYAARGDVENARIVLKKGLEVVQIEEEAQAITQLLTELE